MVQARQAAANCAHTAVCRTQRRQLPHPSGQVYAGHTGGGFNHEGLERMRERLDRLERRTPPFADPPRPNETVHWVEPKVVVEVKFSEWTADGRLRQPIYVGTRDDKDARSVTREGESVQGRA